MPAENGKESAFWSVEKKELLEQLSASEKGLSGEQAARREQQVAGRRLKPKQRSQFSLLVGQFKSPIILILLVAAIISIFVGDVTDAIIILVIIFISGILGFWQERGAANAVAELLSAVQVKVKVMRDGKTKAIDIDAAVPGDIVVLSAGDVIPGDSRILSSNDLFVDEAALTGESYPVEKEEGTVPPDAPLAKRTNALFMGTHVVSGSGQALVVNIGKDTEFGKVSERLEAKPQETEFEHGIRRFGYLLLEVTLMLVIAIFAINVYFHRPVLDSLLFSLALAVGLTPQLLPAIISINLAHGAKQMAKEKVIVKRLASIENFGSMNVLCSDKTGTLTVGKVELESALSLDGEESEEVLLYAYLNATFETGFVDPIDESIRKHKKLKTTGYKKLDEIPYDFLRKRLSIAVSGPDGNLLITKGAFDQVLKVCTHAELEGKQVALSKVSKDVRERYRKLSTDGYRVLALAQIPLKQKERISAEDEKGMTLTGLLVFSDPPKKGAKETVARLDKLGVHLKVITGDNQHVAAHIAAEVGLDHPELLTGSQMNSMSDAALRHRVNQVDVFAEIEPNQKEKIIRALQGSGNVVGFMGDGINDAPALHAADVGISVDTAVDVAKEAAQIVLMEKDLRVLEQGVQSGRLTFANTLKYVFMATSANFGNMFSMAGASLFLSFLPLLPGQILLTNLLTDFPEMTIATDSVDPEMVEQPRRWNVKFIRNFMLVFGPVSSIFDYMTFGLLLWILHASIPQFRTGWYMESVVSATLIVLVIRTRRLFFRSRPGKYLLMATILVVIVTVVIPFTPLARPFGFETLPAKFFPALAVIVLLYVATAELAKRLFYHFAKQL